MVLIRNPKSVSLSLTTRCNLRCVYCSHFSSPSEVPADLPTQEWLDFFKELNACTVTSVTLEGGEVFCLPDLKELIQGIVDNRMRFSILTNGTLITDDLAAFIAASRRCDSVQVSIDGSVASVHDASRGEGNFQKAVEGINALKKYKIPLTVRVTISKHNLYELENICHFLLEEKLLDSFSTNYASYQGLCRKNSQEVQLSVKERSFAMAEILRLNKKYHGRINGAAGPLAEALMWTQMEQSRRSGKTISQRGSLVACGGVLSKLDVRADGVIIPCILMAHIELGRINKDNFHEIWQNHPELNRLRNRSNMSLKDFEFCSGCVYIDSCSGSCPAMAYNLLGSVFHPSPDSCLKRFLEEGGELPNEEFLNL